MQRRVAGPNGSDRSRGLAEQAEWQLHPLRPDDARTTVAEVLERLSLSGPLLSSPLEAPRASVNLGAAGIGHGIMRIAMARDDERLLALAEADANRPALVNVIGSLGLGLAAAAAGLALTN